MSSMPRSPPRPRPRPPQGFPFSFLFLLSIPRPRPGPLPLPLPRCPTFVEIIRIITFTINSNLRKKLTRRITTGYLKMHTYIVAVSYPSCFLSSSALYHAVPFPDMWHLLTAGTRTSHLHNHPPLPRSHTCHHYNHCTCQNRRSSVNCHAPPLNPVHAGKSLVKNRQRIRSHINV